MDQYVLFHFAVTKNNRVFQFIVQPQTPWEDIESVLDELKENMQKLKEEAFKKESENQSMEEAK